MAKATLPPQKIILVDRALQFRYARLGMGVGFFSALLTGFLILYPLYYFKILVLPTFLPLPILLMMSSGILLNIMLIGFFTVSISHRIAGPVYSFVKKFRELQVGAFRQAHVALRSTDDLIFMQRHFNETVDALIAMTQKDLDFVDATKLCDNKEMLQENLNLLSKKLQSRLLP